MEHGAAPLRLPGWARRPRWLPALGRRPSRGAAILGIAGLIVGLAAGYALGYRHLGHAVPPPRATPAGTVLPAAAAVPSRSRLRRAAGFGRVRRRPRRLLLQSQHRGTPRAGPDRRGMLGAARPGPPARRGGDQPLQHGGHPRAGQEHPPTGRTAPDLAAVGALRRDLVLLAGNRRRLVRLRQGVDGRGRDGKLDGPPAATAPPGSASPSGC